MAENINFEMTLNDLVSMRLREADGHAKKFEGTMSGLKNTAMSVGGAIAAAFAVHKLVEFGQSVIDTGAKLETLNNVINYTSLSSKDAAQNHAFLKHLIDDYKLPLIETTEGFSQFNAALMGSQLQGQQARDIFEGVSTAVIAMHLPAEKANSVFLALNQMVSKGTVQAQELKLQLGEALPGAFQKAAEAMGMTTAELTKHMEKGEILASDFLPKFAAKMKEDFGGAIPAAIQSTIARITDLNNKSIDLKQTIFLDTQPAINAMYESFINLTKEAKSAWQWIVKHKELMEGVAEVVGIATVAYLGYKSAIWGAAIAQGVATTYAAASVVVNEILLGWELARAESLGVLAAAQWALNIAMSANPVGLIIAGLAILGGALYVAYKHSETFRGVLMGIWELAKDLGKVFYGLGETIIGALTFNPALIKKGFEDSVAGVADMSGAFQRGYNGAKESTMSANDPKHNQPDKPGKPTAPSLKAGTQSKSKVTGTKSVSIHINIGALVKELKINTTNLRDTGQKIHDEVTKVLLSAVNDSQIISGT